MPRWEPRAASDWPDGLILYDGSCLICSGWVRFVVARDPGGRFRFTPVQSDCGTRFARAFGIDPDDPESNAVVIDGVAYFKSDVALKVVASFPHWRWARFLRLAPRGLRDWLYDRIARNRHALFGRRVEVCEPPAPEFRARIVLE